MGAQKSYTIEFKKTIVSLYQGRKTYSEIQKEYGISHNALVNCIKQYSQVKIDDEIIVTAEQIKALQKRNAQLEEENQILKKNCDIHATLKQRLMAVKILSQEYKISIVCRVLRINRSTFYKFANHKESEREKENQYIKTCILELHERTNKRLGASK